MFLRNEFKKKEVVKNTNAFVLNNPIKHIDPIGMNLFDWTLKKLGMQVPKAVGINWGGVLSVPYYGTGKAINAVVGGELSVIFFPDSCEVGIYSLLPKSFTTGVAELPEWYRERVEKATQMGLIGSAGGSLEFAIYFGNSNPGSANAKSFAGPFHTGQVALIKVGASLYFGDQDPSGGFWVGGTIGLGPGAGGAFIDWHYDLVETIPVEPKCLCDILILQM